jgi:Flp pilus assembly protein TadG
MRYQLCKRRRRGGALAEAAITTSVLLSLMFGTVDMGVAVFRMHVISEAARQGARRAIVHGSLANQLGVWPASAFSASGTSTDPKVTEIQPYLAGLDLSQVTINITWPDAGNQPEQRVTYQVSTTWTPMMTWIFGSPTYTLNASSTMPIAH